MPEPPALPASDPSRAERPAIRAGDALRHVTGSAVFVDDIPEPHGTLHVALGLAPFATGKLTRLDLDPVRSAPDVVAVLTAADASGAWPFQTGDQVRFHGQLLFAVVARNRMAARRAVRLAWLGTAPAMPLIDVEDAISSGATLAADHEIVRGDAPAEILKCDRRLSGQIRSGGQEHGALEAQTVLAEPEEGDGVILYAATENPSGVRRAVAAALGLLDSAVTVEVRRIGGGFGGKASDSAAWAAIAAMAARRTGRPCKLRLDREEEFTATGKRLDMHVGYQAGVVDSGQVRGVDITLSARCGHALDGAADAVDRVLLHADNAYFFPAVRLVGRRMRTDTVPATSVRGAGGPEGALIAERIMDSIAQSLSLDPLDVRKENLYGAGRDRTPYGTPIDDPVMPGIVTSLERASDYRRRRVEIATFNQTSPILKRGLALTPVKCGVGGVAATSWQASAVIELARDGSVHLTMSGVEEGQGLKIKAAQIVAEALGVDVDRVVVGPATTASVAHGPGSLDDNLLAVLDACRVLKERFYDFIEKEMRVDREQVAFQGGEVHLGPRSMDLSALAEAAWGRRMPLTALGAHANQDLGWDPERATGRPFHYFTWGASCSEVTVDVMTGEWRLDRVDILQDAGRSLNPAVDIGQVEGGFMMGLGWLTTEELVWDSGGRLITTDGSTYAMPRATDLPAEFRVELFHSSGNREDTAFRSKDVGDASVMLALSAFSAIFDAIGSLRRGTMPRLNAPATPAAIMRAVRSISDGT